jgi:protein SCO1/2/putative membrane protein
MSRSLRGRAAALLATLLSLTCLSRACAAEDLGAVGPFALTERSGRTVTRDDLLGKVWVASFVFTRCTGGCPQVSATLQDLQKDFRHEPDVRLVTFTVDPDHDDPAELTEYAAHYGADPQRWLFLTGQEDEIYHLLREGFHVGVHQNEGRDRTPGNEVTHSTKLVVVDRQGHIRGYFDGMPTPGIDFDANLRRLRQQVAFLAGPPALPTLNARLNVLSAVLVVCGYLAIRSRRLRLHVACMLLALAVSTAFLGSYLYYHVVVMRGAHTEFVPPSDQDWLRPVYVSILFTHMVLAVLTPPLALLTAWLGWRGRLSRHVWLARWTLPVWLYTSVTGVVVYWMLYRLWAAA